MNLQSERCLWHNSIGPATSKVWDVLIVGAGPAGSMAALHLARRGHQVLLLDKQPFPRHKTCGDGLLPDALAVLERAQLKEAVRRLGNRIQGASVFSPSRIECEIPSVGCLTLKRYLLDALIARKAVDFGAVFCQGEVENVMWTATGDRGSRLAGSERHPDLISCLVVGPHPPTLNFPHKGEGQRWEASSFLVPGGGAARIRVECRTRVLVIATGANVALLRKLGLVARGQASGLAVRCYIRSSMDLDRLVVSYDRSLLPAYAWIFPMGGHEYNVGCGILYGGYADDHANLRKTFWRFVSRFALARDLLRRSEGMSPLRGAQLRCGLQESGSGERWAVSGKDRSLHCRLPSMRFLPILAIGETIGSTFPATGEGIGKAMETAELAAEVIDEALRSGDLSILREFPSRLRARLQARYLGYEIAQRWLCMPWLVDLVARRARQSKFLHQAIAGILNETVDPRTVFSLQGIIKSFAD